MKKRIGHSDLMRKLDNSETQNPIYLDNVKMIKDPGFRFIMGETITKDELRRQAFLNSRIKP
jgi:predicted metal-binding protein